MNDIAAGLRLLFEVVVIGGFMAFCLFFGLWWVPVAIGAFVAVIVLIAIVQSRWSGDV